MAEKTQIVWRPGNEYEEESLAMLQRVYPHLPAGRILAELVNQWRMRQDGRNSKEAKLDMILQLQFEMMEQLRQLQGDAIAHDVAEEMEIA